MRRAMAFALCGVAVLAATAVWAGEAPGQPVAEEPASPPPLPLHSIEGFSGVFLTETAYLVNPPQEGSAIGLPVVGTHWTQINEKELFGATLTVNLFGRAELGYSYQRLSLGDWDNKVERATGLRIGDEAVQLHTIGARLMVLREGEWDTTWVPALTFGVRYKKNTDIDDIDDDLLGTAKTLGVDDDEGIDVTLMASKTFAGILPKPFILSAGVRATEAIHTGFVGFSDDYSYVFEGNAIFFITDRLVFAAEYRQMPNDLKRLGDLVKPEDDWWSVAFAYVCTNNLTVTAGFANVGRVLDGEDDFAWLGQIKWEF